MNEFQKAMNGVRRIKSPDDYQSWRQCKGKVPYFRLDIVEQVIAKWKEKGTILEHYNCDTCGAIHLYHINQ